MKRFLFFFLAIFLFAATSVYGAETGWMIRKFKSDITIQKDGLVAIQETITSDFGVLRKHGIYRYIPVEYSDADGKILTADIRVLSVTDGKHPIPYGTEHKNGNLQLQIGDPNKTVSGKQNYEIRYTIGGVLREFSEYDELYWNVTGNGWPVPIEHSSAFISLPENGIVQISCYFGKSGSESGCGSATTTDSTAVFSSTKTLGAEEGMTIALGFTKGMVLIIQPTVTNSDASDFSFNFDIFDFLISLGATLIFGIGMIYRTWRKNGQDTNQTGEPISPVDTGTIIAEYEPPLHLRPGEIGLLMDETADTLDITATIVDLAVRGYLTIEEIPKKWFLGSTDYSLAKTDKSDNDLLSFEKKLLDALFKNRLTANLSEVFSFLSQETAPKLTVGKKTVKISSLKNSFYQDLRVIKKELYKTVTEKELFVENPESVRTKYSLIAGGMIFAGILIPVLFSKINVGISAGIGIGIFISGIIFVFVAIKAMPKRSFLGHETYRKAQGYKLFISQTEKYRAQFYEKENMLMEVLPYAIVFGVTKKLADAMKEMGMKQPEPAWYHGTAPWNAAVFATGMEDFSKSLSSAMASAPSSSGSGGGGFSGGGFGGGGGGSW